MTRHQRGERRRTKLVAAALIAALVSVVTVLSLRYEGVATADVTLHDGGVWVTKGNDALVGRVNYAAQATDGVFVGPSTDLDVYQDGDLVFTHDLTTSQLYPVDTATVSISPTGIPLPETSRVQLNSGLLNVFTESGETWLIPADHVSSLPHADPMVELGQGGQAVITTRMWWGIDRVSGVLHSGRTAEVIAAVGSEDEWKQAVQTRPLARAIPEAALLQVSATAYAPVLLVQDEQANQVWLTFGAGDPIDLGEYLSANEHLELAAPSDTTGPVAVAYAGGVLLVEESGEITEYLPTKQGHPAQPVIVNGCVYSAWSSELSQLARICADAIDEGELSGSSAGTDLKFRVNRGHVVLNDLNKGQTWQFDGRVVLMDEWEDVRPNEGAEDGDEEPNPINLPDTPPIDRTLANRDPIANDDEFGVRAGTTVHLPVLSNDADPDGDVLTVTALGQLPEEFGVVRSANYGRSFEVTIADHASGSQQLTYQVDDGRDGTDTAQITLQVRPSDVNEPPIQLHDLEVTVSAGGHARVYALVNVIDPDGDPVYLCSARNVSGLTATVDPSGYLAVSAPATVSGRHDVILGFSDGRGTECAETGTAKINVQPRGSAAPVPVYDYANAFVNQKVTIAPLENDVSPSGSALSLSFISEVSGLEIAPALDSGEFEVIASEAGTYYVEYTVVDELGAAALGLVRIDVVEPVQGGIVTTGDTAFLRSLGTVMIAPADNDFDPAGEVLSVTDVIAPAGVSATVIDHEFVAISARGALTEPAQLTYKVANSTQIATGTITVIPVAEESGLGPMPAHDVAVVRAGDYVSVPVLANDKHPGGQSLKLDPELADVADLGGTMFVSNDLIRFLAPEEAGTAQATYTVVDEQGNEAAGLVTITVVESTDENLEPKPADVIGRVYTGDRIQLMVPVHGIDPNGDSVSVLGLASAPQLGVVSDIGSDFFVYQAHDGASGIDEFTYVAQDRLGASAVGTVKIAVLERPDQNRPPYAASDEVTVRPGRIVEFDPLANDSDPDGDSLSYAEPALNTDLQAEVVAGRIRFESPEEQGSYLIQYQVTDTYSAPVTGVATVYVDEEAPLHPPIAIDDLVPIADLVGKSTVTVPVLDNDYDPDGVREDLIVSLPNQDEETGISVVGKDVVIPIAPERQIVMYQVTDSDSLSTFGFIDVPGYDDAPATLNPGAGAVEVVSGQIVNIALNDYVVSARSPQVMIASGAQVQATNSAGNEAALDDLTLRYQSAPGYYGPASITTTVVDSPQASGPPTLVTIPIIVLPAEEVPPAMRGTIVDVARGEEEAVDLAGLITSPGAGNWQFAFEPVSGIGLSQTGSTLRISADQAPIGSELRVEVTGIDAVGARASAVITVRITGSNAPLLIAVDDDLGELRAGVASSHDVLANDFPPPGQSLTLVSVSLLSGQAQVGISGDKVAITPSPGYAGLVEALYVVADETGEVSRRGSAKIRATVPGAPLQMAPPGIQSVGDQHVVLQLTAPGTRGSAITDYLVSYNGGQQVCSSTVCTIDGLTNGQSYSFVATARSAAGDSLPSAASATVRVDRVPVAPATPTVTAGQGQVSATWQAVTASATGITYEVEISPGVRGSTQRKTSATGLEWGGLVNGTAYTLRVRAVNGSGQAGPWSSWSSQVTPYGVPNTPGVPKASAAQGGSDKSVTVTWSAPESNGSPITSYELRIYQNGDVIHTEKLPATATSHTVSADYGKAYGFAVRAINAAGPSGWSNKSETVQISIPLSAPTGVIGVGTGSSGKIYIRHNGATGGHGEVTYQYRLHIGSDTFKLDAESTAHEISVNTGKPNGTAMRASVRACTQDECSPWSEPSPEFKPFGVLAAPNLSMSFVGGSITFSWSSPPDAGAGVANTRYQVQIDGGGFGPWKTLDTANGSATIDLKPGSSIDFRVQAQDQYGNWGTEATSHWQAPNSGKRH